MHKILYIILFIAVLPLKARLQTVNSDSTLMDSISVNEIHQQVDSIKYTSKISLNDSVLPRDTVFVLDTYLNDTIASEISDTLTQNQSFAQKSVSLNRNRSKPLP